MGASIAASVLFGVLFFLPPYMYPMDGFAVFGWRVAISLPVVFAIFAVTGRLPGIAAVLRRIARRPVLGLVIVVDGLLMGVQTWLFGWAPQNGHGLDTALGYLLLPLVMVVLGVTVHREQMSVLRGVAVSCAAIGVIAAVILAGGLSWSTLVVAGGYPLYFLIRRRFGLDTSGALFLEFVVLFPIAIVFLAAGGAVSTLADSPRLIPIVVLFGLLGAVAMTSYLLASRVLPFGLFGLLTYLEPVLLVVVSILFLGEALGFADAFVYGPIVAALVLLGVESTRQREPQQIREAPQLESAVSR